MQTELEQLKAERDRLREALGKSIGWVYKIIVNKHVTGPPLKGQIQIDGAWGTPSSHVYFSLERPTEGFIYWEAPVYTLAPATFADGYRAGLEDAAKELEADPVLLPARSFFIANRLRALPVKEGP